MSCRRCGGKLFHTCGPAALKLQSPKLFRVHGTKHVLMAAECRDWRSVSVTSRTSSARYAGVRPASDWCTRHATLWSTNRKLVQLTQHRRDVIASTSPGDQTCGGVLDRLDLPKMTYGHDQYWSTVEILRTWSVRLEAESCWDCSNGYMESNGLFTQDSQLCQLREIRLGLIPIPNPIKWTNPCAPGNSC